MPIGRLMLAVIGAVGGIAAEGEGEGRRDGIAKAKRDGRYKGRVPPVRRQSSTDLSTKNH